MSNKYKSLIGKDSLQFIKASELVPSEKNPRLHPSPQMDAMREILEEFGYAGAMIAYKQKDGKFKLIDGHLRTGLAENDEVPVLVLNCDEETGKRLMTVFDPVGEMAQYDPSFRDLIAESDFHQGAIAAMLAQIETIAKEAEESSGKEKKKDDCVYPIVPVFNEKYDYVLIFAKNTIEFAYLQTVLQLRREKSYKSTHIGIGRVIAFDRFQKLWESRSGKPDMTEVRKLAGEQEEELGRDPNAVLLDPSDSASPVDIDAGTVS